MNDQSVNSWKMIKTRTETLDDSEAETFLKESGLLLLPQDFPLGNLLNERGEAKIYHCDSKKFGPVVIRQVKSTFTSHLLNQLYLTCKVSEFHPYLIKYFGCFKKDDTVCVVMEKFESNLEDYISGFEESLETEQKYEIALQCAKSIHYLHTENHIHCDIKPQKFLVKKDLNGRLIVKLSDFGSLHTKQKSNSTTKISNIFGTIGAGELETLQQNKKLSETQQIDYPYSFSCDVFSFGCVLARLFYPNGLVIDMKRNVTFNVNEKDPKRIKKDPLVYLMMIPSSHV